MAPGMIVQAAAGVAGDETVQVDTVTERQAQQVVALEVGLRVGPVDDPATQVGGKAEQQAIEQRHVVSSKTVRGIIPALVAHKVSHIRKIPSWTAPNAFT